MPGKTISDLAHEVREFVLRGFHPHFNELKDKFATDPAWVAIRKTGTDLWLDTGDLDEAEPLWTREFSALTTNNTLLNRQVQKGIYDRLIREADEMLRPYDLDGRRHMLEMAFILNARHALRLVEKFDAMVSVEEHTDLAGEVGPAVECARRYHDICPQRFIIKVPFTPAGLLVSRQLSDEFVPVNHTLGFSARQNYLIARLARPKYVNVFLGRLNSFVADNRLGDGTYVGEKATLASQAAVRNLRQQGRTSSLQIGASLRGGAQVRDLAGIDVMTMPPNVAREFLDLRIALEELTDRTTRPYEPPLAEGVDPKAVRLDTLWEVGEKVADCVEALEKERLTALAPEDLVDFFADHGCGDVLVRWRPEQVATSAKEGKIPRLDNWRQPLAEGRIGLDSLMNLAGLNSFATDQKAMDDRVRQVLGK